MREMQIKPIIRYHFTPTRMVIIKRQTITGAAEDVEKMTPSYTDYWWECIMIGSLQKIVS